MTILWKILEEPFSDVRMFLSIQPFPGGRIFWIFHKKTLVIKWLMWDDSFKPTRL
jgi:hypothetical protein